jgi:hypothetical protein
VSAVPAAAGALLVGLATAGAAGAVKAAATQRTTPPASTADSRDDRIELQKPVGGAT